MLKENDINQETREQLSDADTMEKTAWEPKAEAALPQADTAAEENGREAGEAPPEEEISHPLSYYKELKQQSNMPNNAAPVPKEAEIAADTEQEDFSHTLTEKDYADDIYLYGSEHADSISEDGSEAEDDDFSHPLDKGYYAAETEKNTEIQTEMQPAPQKKKAPLFPVKGSPFGVQAIAETAVLASIGVILGFITNNVPILSIFAQLLFPLPMAILTMRRGLAMGICGTAVTGLLMSLIVNPVSALLLIIQTGIVGLFFGYCSKKGKKPLFTLTGGTFIAALGYAAAMVLSMYISDISFASVMEGIDDMIAAYAETMKNMGYYEILIAQGIDPNVYMDKMMSLFRILVPGALIISVMLITMASYWLFGKIIKALGYEYQPLPPFREWRLSVHFIWGLILGLGLWYFGFAKENQILYNIGTNILYVFMPLLLITGIAIIVGICKARDWHGFSCVLIWLLVFMLMPYSLILLILMAAFDPLVNFRRLFAKKDAKGC